ncbi:hypothetical protein CR105_25535 [Massilia eurypsychrophila]|uniref:Lysis protein n=1 Tax=Massilia eurypsychrophila TaxID=1485217 RepID=A0A2G8T896_9BURK|nr:lysis system i-spanin subunit Rz [Massilia eurypsychrophila]PIL42232.1 hypothetical protein CR105_25535 [Massilia eurypsychrophila]
MNPYTIIGGIVLAIALCLGGASVGKRLERTAWQAKELATAAAAQKEMAAAQDRYVRLQKFNEATARKASADHEKAIATLSQQYDAARAAIRAAGGLRVPRAICQTNGAVEGPGAGRFDDAATATVKLPDRVTEDLLNLTKRADELAERLRALQAWVRAAGHYGEPTVR